MATKKQEPKKTAEKPASATSATAVKKQTTKVTTSTSAKTASVTPAATKPATAVQAKKTQQKPASVTPAATKSAAVKPVAKKPAAAKLAAKKPAVAKPASAKPAPVKPEVKPEVKPDIKEAVTKFEKDINSTVPKLGTTEVTKPQLSSPKNSESDKKNILFVCSEAFPFAGTGGLGEVMGSLPRAINQNPDSKYSASIILPLYESFPYDERKNLEFVCHINIPLAWRNQYCGLFKYNYQGTVYYFIDNEYYFKRPNLYGYYDDGERFAFLSRAVVELIPYLDKKPDILHCQDWQTALVPIYYKLFYMYREGFGGIKTIFTIHNIEYQGKYAKSIIEDVFGIPYYEYLSIEHKGCINLMKGAIDYSDAISTVSQTYAKEIMMPFYAHGLEDVLIKNSYKLHGILNGVDTESYNPETNKALFKNYSVKAMAGKADNKRELQKMLSLPQEPKVPVIAIISRLVAHKGLDLIRFAINEILKKDVQLVLLGKGDPDYEGYFTHVQKTYDQKMSTIITFNKDLSHKIYAGADIFLMPSKSEPCGLSQMMACRYGTIPVVRATGGLKDSITDCDNGDIGNGFVFNNYDAGDMLHAINRAVGLYTDYHDKWTGLVERAMNTDFSWSNSAREYIKFYNELF